MGGIAFTSPQLSKAFREANPHLFGNAPVESKAACMVKKPREMNKTEEEFSRILEAKVKRGELSEFRYEGMKLAWSGMLYTPDFCAWDHLGALTFYEVKGAHIFSRDIVRFKGCRAQWPRYQFEMWQKSKREWRQIL